MRIEETESAVNKKFLSKPILRHINVLTNANGTLCRDKGLKNRVIVTYQNVTQSRVSRWILNFLEFVKTQLASLDSENIQKCN